MGTKLNPGKFDCYANAEPGEPMFVLLARDVAAPAVVEAWAAMRVMLINAGLKPIDDVAMVSEARDLAHAMRRWREENRK